MVASPNAARRLLAAVDAAAGARDGPVKGVPDVPVAAVGPSTAAMFDASPLVVDIVPNQHLAEGLVDAIGPPSANGARLLLPQAEVARPVLADGLAELGWQVDRVVAYRTVTGDATDKQRAAAAQADAVAFTSSSTVSRFVEMVGDDLVADGKPKPVAISIGPITSATAVELGFVVGAEASPHTIDGLIDAVVEWVLSSASGLHPEP